MKIPVDADTALYFDPLAPGESVTVVLYSKPENMTLHFEFPRYPKDCITDSGDPYMKYSRGWSSTWQLVSICDENEKNEWVFHPDLVQSTRPDYNQFNMNYLYDLPMGAHFEQADLNKERVTVLQTR